MCGAQAYIAIPFNRTNRQKPSRFWRLVFAQGVRRASAKGCPTSLRCLLISNITGTVNASLWVMGIARDE
ncbi:hypothetical protein [Nostoc sp. PCC 9305]|uniref:hypothetical protein n=1 Tax=Nostoc sp. PCC 9305 TaxID=296636 RepID=UPI0039C5DA41